MASSKVLSAFSTKAERSFPRPRTTGPSGGSSTSTSRLPPRSSGNSTKHFIRSPNNNMVTSTLSLGSSIVKSQACGDDRGFAVTNAGPQSLWVQCIGYCYPPHFIGSACFLVGSSDAGLANVHLADAGRSKERATPACSVLAILPMGANPSRGRSDIRVAVGHHV